jgi:hypothetical protein
MSAKTVVDEKAPESRQELHNLVTHFDGARKSYKRKEKLKKMLPHLLKLAGVLAVAGLVYAFWQPIWDAISGLIARFGG